MRRTLFLAVLVLLLSVCSASAATPVAPATGSSFTTTDLVDFEAQPEPAETDEDYLFVFSVVHDFAANRWFGLGGENHELRELDLGWLAGKLDHIGRYWWALCPVTEASQVLTDQCSAPATFSLRFRLPDLRRSWARSDARFVMNHKFRPYWRGGYNRRFPVLR